MCFFFSLIPTTMIAVIGFFVLFAASRTEGTVQTVGKVLGIWLFVLALLPLGAGTYATLSGMCPIGGHMMSGKMGRHMSYGSMRHGDMTSCMKGAADCPMAKEMDGAMMTPKAEE